MNITQINHSIISFSSELLDLKENLEKISKDLNVRDELIKTQEIVLLEKQNFLINKETELENESERLESFKKASLVNKLYKELDSLKSENKLLKKSFYKKNYQKSKIDNFRFLRILSLDMSFLIEKTKNIELMVLEWLSFYQKIQLNLNYSKILTHY